MSAAVIFRMGADSAGLKKDLEAAGQMARRTAGNITSNFGKSAAGALKGSIAGVLGGGAIVEAGKAVLDFAGNLADASDAMGIGVEALQELYGSFSQSGAGIEVVNKGLSKLSENLATAKAGGAAAEKMVASFGSLGVTWQDINTLAPDEILMRIAASSKDAQNPAERLAAIVDVLGKSGLRMAAGLNSGDEALRNLRSGVSKLSDADVQVLDNVGDGFERLGNKAKVAAAKYVLAMTSFDPKRIAKMLSGYDAVSAMIGGDVARNDVAPPPAAKPAATIPDSPQEAARKKALADYQREMDAANAKYRDEETAAQAQANAWHVEQAEQKAEDQRQFFAEEEAYEREKLQNILDYEKRIAKAREDGAKQLAGFEDRQMKAREQRAKATLAQAVQAQLSGPDARREERRQEGVRQRAESKVKRKKALGDREGMSEADWQKKNPLFGPEVPLLQRTNDLKRGGRPVEDTSEKSEDFQAALDKAKVLQDIRDNIKEVQNAQ